MDGFFKNNSAIVPKNDLFISSSAPLRNKHGNVLRLLQLMLEAFKNDSKCGGTNPNLFLGKMYAEKVSVKAMNFWNKKWCRVSIGTKENMEKFLSAFDKALI